MEEFELTFLPKSLPSFSNLSFKKVMDVYIPSTAEHPYLRIRHSGDKCEITKKRPIQVEDPSHQMETTIPLETDEFNELVQLPGKRIRKIRYLYEEDGFTYEIDVFQDSLEGLVLVDLEFKSLEEKSAYKKPEWLLAEVTQEDFIAGGMLSGKSYSDIESRLSKFGYKKLPY